MLSFKIIQLDLNCFNKKVYLKDFSLKFIFISNIHVILHHPKLSTFLQQLNKYQLWFYQAADWTISESEICDFSNIFFFWNLAKSKGWWSCVNISIHLSYQWFFSNHPRGISIEDVFFYFYVNKPASSAWHAQISSGIRKRKNS